MGSSMSDKRHTEEGRSAEARRDDAVAKEGARRGVPITGASSLPDANIDAQEAAEFLGLDVATVQQLVASGELPALSQSGEPLTLRRGDIDAYRDLLYERRNDFIGASSAAYEGVLPGEAARLLREVRAARSVHRR